MNSATRIATRKFTRRQLRHEMLETRRLLAFDVGTQSPIQPLDVNVDAQITPLDALIVINDINRRGSRPIDQVTERGFVDVTGDGALTPRDALFVINAINRSDPLLSGRLIVDSAPDQASNFDFITNEFALELGVDFESGDEIIEGRVNADTGTPFSDVSSFFEDGSLQLSELAIEQLSGGVIEDGENRFEFRFAGSEEILSFTVLVDRIAPRLDLDGGPLIRVASDQITADFGEAVSIGAGNFSIASTTNQNPTIIGVDSIENGVSTITTQSKIPDGQFELIFSGTVVDLAGNEVASASTAFEVADPTGIVSISPNDGELGVSVSRETIIRFDEPVDPSTVTTDTIQVFAAGRPISGRIRVNRTAESATIFYDEPLPASTAVSVQIDGTAIRGADGLPLDADGDNEPGGQSSDTFRTLPLTLIPETIVFGVVEDSQTQQPLEGVRITLEAFPEIFAITNADGEFELGTQDLNNDGIPDGLPAPEFFALIDGSQVVSANGRSYVGLGKPISSVPGQRTELAQAGVSHRIFLPSIPDDASVAITAGEDTTVGLSDQSLDDLGDLFQDENGDPLFTPEELTQLQVTIPADAAINDQGETAASAFVVPVDPDFLPAPLPANLDPSLVVSIQTPGATNFDIPAPVTFPNLDDLAPGEQVLLFSFNHDAGRFEVNGSATVSENGLSITSDPGVGINAPGWHFVQPGTNDTRRGIPSGSGEGGPLDDEQSPADEPAPEEDPPPEGTFEWGVGIDGSFDPLFFEFNFGVQFNFEQLTRLRELLEEADELTTPQLDDFFNRLTSTIESITRVRSQSFRVGVLDEPFEFEDFGFGGRFTVENEFLRRFVPEFDIRPIADFGVFAGASIGGSLTFDFELNRGSNLLEFDLDGALNASAGVSVEIGNSIACDIPLGIGDQICSEHQIFGFAASIGEDGPSVNNGFLGGGLSRENFFDTIVRGSNLDDLVEEFRTLPFVSPVDLDLGFSISVSATAGARATVSPFAFLRELDSGSSRAASNGANNLTAEGEATEPDLISFTTETNVGSSNLYYRYLLGDGAEIAGRADDDGNFNAVLPPNRDFELYVFDPGTNTTEVFGGRTGPSGTATGGDLELSFVGGFDFDQDGLSNTAELVIGTDPRTADSDGDGQTDFGEVSQQTDPLGGLAFPTGIIASLPLGGQANEITISGSADNPFAQTAFIATGSNGLSIVDVSQFDNPILLSEIDLPGFATDVAVDPVLERAAVATGGGGLQIVDVSDPINPFIVDQVPGQVDHIEIDNGLAYTINGTQLQVFDLVSGEQVSSSSVVTNRVTGFSFSNGLAYAFGNDTLSIIDPSENAPLSTLGVPIASFDVGLTVANEIVYLAGSGITTVDVSDPEFPELISTADNFFTSRNIRLNGSGLAINVAEGAGIGLFDITDPEVTDSIVTAVDTPGFAESVAIGSGIAFVADGFSGLQVINYLPFDRDGNAPTIELQSQALDRDPEAAGVQVEEGTTVPLNLQITDDVQVRNVELIVNGTVTQNDVSFPFDFAAVVPNLSAGTDQLTIQVRATDTGGNSSASDPVVLNIIPDITPPTLAQLTPNGATLVGTQLVSFAFDEPISSENVDLSSVEIRDLDMPSNAQQPISVSLQNDDRTVLFRFGTPFNEGAFQLVYNEADFTDRAGNPLGNQQATQDFDVVDATSIWINPAGGEWFDPSNWSTGVVPGPEDGVLISLLDGATVTIGGGEFGFGNVDVTRITLDGNLRVTPNSSLQSDEIIVRGGQITNNGTLLNSLVFDARDNPSVQEDSTPAVILNNSAISDVIFNASVLVNPSSFVRANNTITINDTLTLTGSNNNAVLSFSGGGSLDGTGEVVFSRQNNPTRSSANRLEIRNAAFDVAEVLTIGSDLTLTGELGQITSNNPVEDTINLAGTVRTTGDNGSLTLGGIDSGEGSVTIDGQGVRIDGQVRNTNFVAAESESVLRLISSANIADVVLDVNSIIDPSSFVTAGESLTVNETLTLAGGTNNAVLSFSGGGSLDGTGEVVFSRQNNPTRSSANRLEIRNAAFDVAEVLTIGSDLTLTGELGQITSNNPVEDTINLAGTVRTTGDNGSLTLGGIDSGEGSVTIDGQGVRIDGQVRNTNFVAAESESVLRLISSANIADVVLDVNSIIDPSSFVTAGESLTVNETLTLAGGTNNAVLSFSGGGSLDGTGEVVFSRQNNPTRSSANRLEIRNAAFDVAEVLTIGSDLTLTGELGQITSNNPVEDTINLAGTVRTTGDNGSLTLGGIDSGEGSVTIDGQGVRIDGQVRNTNFVAAESESVLRLISSANIADVVLDVNSIIDPSSFVTAGESLTVNETLTLAGGTNNAVLSFSGGGSLDGTGEVVFSRQNNPTRSSANRLEIRNAAFDVAEVLTIGSDLTLTGELGQITSNNPVEDTINLAGTVRTTGDNGSLTLGGIDSGEGSVTIDGQGVRIDGQVRNTNFVAAESESVLRLISSANIADVVLDVNSIIDPSSFVTAGESLTVNETLTLAGGTNNAVLSFSGGGSLDGTGEVVFSRQNNPTRSSANRLEIRNAAFDVAEVLIIGSDLTIGGFGNLSSNNPNQDTVDILGAIFVSTGDELILGTGVRAAVSLLEVTVAGSDPGQFGRITGSGTLVLPNTLRIIREGDFVPAVGDRFPIIDVGEILGEVTTTDDAVFGDLQFELDVDLDEDTLTLLAAERN